MQRRLSPLSVSEPGSPIQERPMQETEEDWTTPPSSPVVMEGLIRTIKRHPSFASQLVSSALSRTSFAQSFAQRLEEQAPRRPREARGRTIARRSFYVVVTLMILGLSGINGSLDAPLFSWSSERPRPFFLGLLTLNLPLHLPLPSSAQRTSRSSSAQSGRGWWTRRSARRFSLSTHPFLPYVAHPFSPYLGI